MGGWRDDPGAGRGLAGAERRPEKSPAAEKKSPVEKKRLRHGREAQDFLQVSISVLSKRPYLYVPSAALHAIDCLKGTKPMCCESRGVLCIVDLSGFTKPPY